MTNHLHEAIKLLESATQSLNELTTIPVEQQPLRETVATTVEQINRALAELSAAINPPSLEQVPVEILAKAERLGIPLADIEVRVAITTHHLSQFIGILNEIEQRFVEIRRVREYLLVRLPDIPIEQLGSRLPVYTAADFEWTEPRLSPSDLAQVRAKYQIDRLLQQPPRHSTDLFKQIAAADLAWQQARLNSSKNTSVDPPPNNRNDTSDFCDLPLFNLGDRD
jgi:hypothetical protein